MFLFLLITRQRYVTSSFNRTSHMKLPCCLVSDAGRPMVERRRVGAAAAAQRHMNSHARNSAPQEHVTARWIGLALLLASVVPRPGHEGESTSVLGGQLIPRMVPNALLEVAHMISDDETSTTQSAAFSKPLSTHPRVGSPYHIIAPTLHPAAYAVDGAAGRAVSPSRRSRTSPERLWEQVTVSNLAVEIGSEEFLHDTDVLLRRGLFPIIYRCFVQEIVLPHARRTSLAGQGQSPSSWTCECCRKWHHSVREACVRCGASNPRASKLFIGQLPKEVPCDELLEKIVWATTVDETGNGVIPLRVEGHVIPLHRQHERQHQAAPRLGKGCGSVYLVPADAERLVQLIHNNVFLDVDWATGAEVLYFCYTEQRVWFQQYVSARIARSGPQRPAHLPMKSVVCELAATTSVAGAATAACHWPSLSSLVDGGCGSWLCWRRSTPDEIF